MAEFIRRARTFESEIRVTYLGDRHPRDDRPLEGLDGKRPKSREVDGKTIFGLMSLEGFAQAGDRLRITADGPDAREAVEALSRYLEVGLEPAERGRIRNTRDQLDRLLEAEEAPERDLDRLAQHVQQSREALELLARRLDLETTA